MSVKVGINEEVKNQNTFEIFPNPATDFFTLIVDESHCPYNILRIYDASGEQVLIQEKSNNCAPKIKCPAAPGIYLVEIVWVNKRETRKVIIR
jgi:hypothetical protein